jgi:CheY-like chemotaxis protein
VERVASASRSLLAIVNDVLDFSKLEAGEVSLAPRATAPAVLVSEAVELFEQAAAEKGLALAFEADEDLPAAVRVDPERTRQVLVNLIGNAVKFTDHGGVSVRLVYDAATGRLAVAVADTGPGIPAAHRERLFQRFTQVDGSSTRSKGGSGLGLSISRKLAQAMGGEISLKSRVGRGSTFTLVLPAPPADLPAAVMGDSKALARLEGVRVLVADDNPINRELARAILEPAGVEMSEAVDGAEAVGAAARLPVDLILMDLRMPGLDGLQAAWAIRRKPGPNQDIPILAFTADGELRDGAMGPFTGRVGKPVAPAALLTAVAEAISLEFEPVEEELRREHG